MLSYRGCSNCALRLRKPDLSGDYCIKYNKCPEDIWACWIAEQDHLKEKKPPLALTDAEMCTIRMTRLLLDRLYEYIKPNAFARKEYTFFSRCAGINKALAEMLEEKNLPLGLTDNEMNTIYRARLLLSRLTDYIEPAIYKRINFFDPSAMRMRDEDLKKRIDLYDRSAARDEALAEILAIRHK